MDENEELQQIIKNIIEATTKGVFEFINKENIIVDKFFKNEIPNAMLEVAGTKQVSEYINEELAKVGIIYKKIKD
ncbi:hypothetical protein SD427_18145 [Chryseobacterium sp. JJR-5R]|uniref:hypothetical protein n=1 Tax=Chryseobacterium sp. JJR-5R TaxID=3093923 RepID=UPI002A760EFE|nr:hypothetical protein [Chryseobacterium sp. JJR-5R]WPO82660.1 hypothetical protein SD427_18145 [Chryseobacterium sp. JJR-5R]